MHILGKIFTWLILLGAVAAVVLTSKLFQVRNSWVQKSTQLKTQIEDNTETLEQRRGQRNELRSELHRTMLGWNRYWNNVQIQQLNPAEGRITAPQIGSNVGLEQGGILYAFQPDVSGNGYVYVGPFEVTDLRENQSALSPEWRIRDGEPQNWNYGPDWRLRENIPTSHKAAFTDLEVELTQADILHRKKQELLAAENKLKEYSELHRDLRLGELQGDPENEKYRGKIADHLIDGLIRSLQNEEEKRNALLAEVDRLRREVNDTYRRYQELRSDVRQLAQSLPGSAKPVTVSSAQ